MGVLYISPLKALINDQFYRLEDLLEYSNTSVHKWHGDVSQYKKEKLLKNPNGILQITPESLESLLINKRLDIFNLFCDLRFVVIDEIHSLINSERGLQVLCGLKRISDITKQVPRRIGLSATLGNKDFAEVWLSAETGRKTVTHNLAGRSSIRLSLENFVRMKDEPNANVGANIVRPELMGQTFNEYLYEITKNKRCIIFCESKAEVESTISMLKRVASEKHTDDIYTVHHGNISKTIREETENKLKSSDSPIVTGATITLELGIDIENLERIVQLNSPGSVSSFLQRLGRTGRRGLPSEMFFVCEEMEQGNQSIEKMINWNFLECIAIIQLYIEEKWIEGLSCMEHPYNLLYHQTVSSILTASQISPKSLASKILTMWAFRNISQDEYKHFLNHLININHIEKLEDGDLILGIEAERIATSYNFYSVFETMKDYKVIEGTKEIGSIHFKIAIGEKFTLAGKTWQVTDIDDKSDIIFVKASKGASNIYWRGNVIGIDTKIVKKVKDILESDENYIYLRPNAVNRLNLFRNIYKKSNLKLVNELAENLYIIFPWLGTKELTTFKYCLLENGLKIKELHDYYIIVQFGGTIDELKNIIYGIKHNKQDKYKMKINDSVNCKFEQYIPVELLEKQYIEDYIDVESMQEELIM